MASSGALVLGTAEAAKILKVDRKTVIRWAEKGKLPALRKLDGQTGGYIFEAGVVQRLADELEQAKAPRRAS